VINSLKTCFLIFQKKQKEYPNLLLVVKDGKMKRKTTTFVIFILILLACATPTGTINVSISRDLYQPGLDPSTYNEYKRQIMIFDSMDIVAPDVTNFYYLSEDKTVGYTLSYTSTGLQQPVVSFFWYALQKAFVHIGIDIREGGPIINAAQLNLKIMSLSDQEAKFTLTLSRNGLLLLKKIIIVSKKFPNTKDVSELQKRSYEFIDHIAETILSDPDFKREFFSEKGIIN
jgi:hypothetical protein